MWTPGWYLLPICREARTTADAGSSDCSTGSVLGTPASRQRWRASGQLALNWRFHKLSVSTSAPQAVHGGPARLVPCSVREKSVAVRAELPQGAFRTQVSQLEAVMPRFATPVVTWPHLPNDTNYVTATSQMRRTTFKRIVGATLAGLWRCK